jgi:hypothetical protein
MFVVPTPRKLTAPQPPQASEGQRGTSNHGAYGRLTWISQAWGPVLVVIATINLKVGEADYNIPLDKITNKRGRKAEIRTRKFSLT